MTVEQWVSKYRNTRMKSFYPDVIAKELGISNEEMIEKCLKLEDENIITPLFEIKCLKCLEILKTAINIIELNNYFEENQSCMYCNDEIDFENNVVVLYKFVK